MSIYALCKRHVRAQLKKFNKIAFSIGILSINLQTRKKFPIFPVLPFFVKLIYGHVTNEPYLRREREMQHIKILASINVSRSMRKNARKTTHPTI